LLYLKIKILLHYQQYEILLCIFYLLEFSFWTNAILNSPFDPNLICPQADSNGYSVDGFPGIPYKITPFVDQFTEPLQLLNQFIKFV
jgi:hypothetical protein